MADEPGENRQAQIVVAYDLVVPYAIQHGTPLPVLAVGVQSRGGRLGRIQALIDTGAEMNLFEGAVALDLGFDPRHNETRSIPITGISGPASLHAYVHPVTLYLGSAVRFHAMSTEVAFTDPDVALTANVLGRRGFLDQISLGVRHGALPPRLYLGFAP